MNKELSRKIACKEACIGVLGLGYVGLSHLEAFAEAGFPLIGFDIDRKKVKMLQSGKSYLNFMPLHSLFAYKKFKVSSDAHILDQCDVLIICVPTSLDTHHLPDLCPLRAALHTVADHLHKGELIILQSTTYPGTTEEELLPLLKASRHLKLGRDFFVAYVPEVSDPGSRDFSWRKIPKIVSGVTSDCLALATLLYETAECEVVQTSSTKVAEAAKILQNTYRLVNISLINELKILFDRMGIDIWEVVKAASSKPFGFAPFYPSPGVGGDCIPVDPMYLIWQAKAFDGQSSLIEIAEHINESVPHYVVDKIMQGLGKQKKGISGAHILLLGVSYKKDVNDIRESAALSILAQLQENGADIHYHDPYVDKLPKLARYPHLHLHSEKLDYKKLNHYDAIVIVTDHSLYDIEKIVANSKLVIDTRNVTSHLRSKKIIKA